ncbi:MAG: hypothetical protein NTZ97_01855 [Candidatus Moranbacteria bacterium]|nr:hypothetical protein [Candidatus Moranbacteria bacterium]
MDASLLAAKLDIYNTDPLTRKIIIKESVKKGIILLDEKLPGWIDRINPEKIDQLGTNFLGVLSDDPESLAHDLDISGQESLYGFSPPMQLLQAYRNDLELEWKNQLMLRIYSFGTKS